MLYLIEAPGQFGNAAFQVRFTLHVAWFGEAIVARPSKTGFAEHDPPELHIAAARMLVKLMSSTPQLPELTPPIRVVAVPPSRNRMRAPGTTVALKIAGSCTAAPRSTTTSCMRSARPTTACPSLEPTQALLPARLLPEVARTVPL